MQDYSQPDHAPSGLSSTPFLSWGSHIGHLFDTAEGLREALVPYFRAGLENHERCLWVTDGPAAVEAARSALRLVMPDLDERERSGQIEISYTGAFYDPDQPLKPEAIVEGLLLREREAMAAGYQGLRTNGDCAWVDAARWGDFLGYESGIQRAVNGRRLICMCSYRHDLIDPDQVKDVIERHHLILRDRAPGSSDDASALLPPDEGAPRKPDPADLIALLNEDLADSKALHELSLHMLVEHEPSALYGRIVEAASQLLRSDCASLQMLSLDDASQPKLELITHCGFSSIAAEHWREVYIDSTTSCGFALTTGERVIVPDIDTCAFLQGTRDLVVFRETGIRSMQSTPLRSRDGNLIGMLSTHWSTTYEPSERQLQLLDILAREAADLIKRTRDEALLRESEARLKQMDRMKDQFLATLGHELRNPLAPIRNGLQILRHGQRGQESAESARILEMLDRQIDHMVRLVDDLVEVARINSGSIQLNCKTIDIAAALNAALDLSRTAVEKAEHTLTVRVEPGVTFVNADEVRLAQVFSNLINNAAIYTPRGGAIDITVARRGQRAEVMIRDTGLGFSADDQRILFTPFGRLRPDHYGEGLGIGLALSKTLVGLHGGSISASSDGRNKGSCFVVSLPAVESSDRIESVEQGNEAAGFDAHTVLVVDDNRDAADSFGELLRALGCTCTVCYDAHDALSALEQLRPTIAFVDLGMPGMDGYQFAQEVRSRPGIGTLRLVALTGWSQPEDRARSAQAGFDLHLVKPAGIQDLIAVLGEGRAADGGVAETAT
jgi:signal transduction histidine kinase/ActR/RegA family two-component response regulator